MKRKIAAKCRCLDFFAIHSCVKSDCLLNLTHRLTSVERCISRFPINKQKTAFKLAFAAKSNETQD